MGFADILTTSAGIIGAWAKARGGLCVGVADVGAPGLTFAAVLALHVDAGVEGALGQSTATLRRATALQALLTDRLGTGSADPFAVGRDAVTALGTFGDKGPRALATGLFIATRLDALAEQHPASGVASVFTARGLRVLAVISDTLAEQSLPFVTASLGVLLTIVGDTLTDPVTGAGSASALAGRRLGLFATLGDAGFGAATALGTATLGTIAAMLADALLDPLASRVMAPLWAGGRLGRVTVLSEAGGGHSAGAVGTTLTGLWAILFDAGLEEGAAGCGAALLANGGLGLFAAGFKASLIGGPG